MKRFTLLALLLLASGEAAAGAFANTDRSASAMGLSNAFVATADDVSALGINPAGIAWQSPQGFMAGTSIRYRNSSVQRPGLGVAPNTGVPDNALYLYAYRMPHDSNFGYGIATDQPYLVNNHWPDLAGSSDTLLDVRRFSGDGIWALDSSLALGAGLDGYFARAEMVSNGQRFSGRDKASFGGHLSAMWKPQRGLSFGGTLRSGSNLSVSGAGGTMKLRLPESLAVGVAIDSGDTLRSEIDLEWTRWSATRSMSVVKNGVTVQPRPLKLRDTLDLSYGLTWSWAEKSTLRFGYSYLQAANRNDSLNPGIADQPGHRLAMGLGGDMFGAHFDFAYSYTHCAKRSVSGPYAGNYRDRQQTFGISASNFY